MILSAALLATAQVSAPNIVVLMADDLGYADLGCYGSTTIATPRIDAMASQGVLATSFYAQPSCSPTRAALMTGSSPQRVGIVQPLSQWGDEGLAGTEETIAEKLAAAGYTTGYFGKWHLGDSPDQLPDAQGFQDVLANPWGHLITPSAYIDSRTTEWEWEPDARFDTQRFTARTIEFITQANAVQVPFFCVLSYTAPHYPAVASPAFQGVSADGRDYGDSVEEMDASVGQILDTIDMLGIGPNTLVIFMSDNGPAQGQGDYQAGSAGALRGSKGSTFEGGVRVPFVARRTGVLPTGVTIDDPMADIDLFPTFVAMAGASPTPGVVIDGVDVQPVLQGMGGDPMRSFFYVHKGRVEGVRRGDFKLREGELFDLANDLGETTDISASDPTTVMQLAAEISAFEQDLAVNGRPVGEQQRIVYDWRADRGLSGASPHVDGDWWRDADKPTAQWTIDGTHAAGFEIFPREGNAPVNSTFFIMRQIDTEADLRFVRTEPDMSPTGGFTMAMWHRHVPDALTTPMVLLDIGDETSGMSWTVGDAGLVDDDQVAGLADDIRVRIGGTAHAASVTLTADMPGAWLDRITHIVVSYDPEGVVRLFVQGRFAAEATFTPGTGLSWGADGDWAMFGSLGQIGGNGGPGELPFVATGCAGDIGGFNLRDRPFFDVEVEREYARNAEYAYCLGRNNIAGTPATLDLRGSFFLDDKGLEIVIDDLPSGTFGYLIASETQNRIPISNGYVCLSNPIYRLAGQVAMSDPTGHVSFVLDRSIAPPQLGLDGAPALNFQFWYRDGAGSNFSNGVSVIFSP